MKEKKLLFVASSGGHMTQILQMKDMFLKYDYLLVTENDLINKELKNKYNIEYVLSAGEGRDFMYWRNFLLNFFLASKILLSFKPDFVITTGSHTAIPFCYIGKLLGAKVIYVLSYARIYSKAKAANIVYPITDLFVVQWRQAKKLYKRSIYLGGGLY